MNDIHPKRWSKKKIIFNGAALVFCIVVALFWMRFEHDRRVAREFNGWRSHYEEELNVLEATGNEYNALIHDQAMSQNQQLAKLADIAQRIGSEYEVYQSRSKGYMDYLTANKDAIEGAAGLTGLRGVEAEKRRVLENDARMHQNVEIVKDALQAAVNQRTANQQLLQGALGLLVGLL